MEGFLAFSARVETIYLGVLRVVVLVVATFFVLAAGFFLATSAVRLATSTQVAEQPVQVAPAEALASVAAKKDVDSQGGANSDFDKAAKARQAAFVKGPFAAYYNAYAAVARKYNKPEDRILTREELAAELGYTADAYQSGDDQTVRAFADDAEYAAQITAAAAALAQDRRVTGQLQQYRAAQKTAQICSTDYVAKRAWDPYSTACSDWYEYPQGCSVIRSMPVQKCAPAYPEGITSPLQAFAQMDRAFRAIWTERRTAAVNDAQAKRAALEARKASGLPALLEAGKGFVAFLAAMFIFLVIAIERHLRSLAKAGGAPSARLGVADAARAEG